MPLLGQEPQGNATRPSQMANVVLAPQLVWAEMEPLNSSPVTVQS
jgi:hypothetical protein